MFQIHTLEFQFNAKKLYNIRAKDLSENRQVQILLLILIFMSSCRKPEEPPLTIAVSANMQFAMMELEKAYEKESGTDIEVILGSSGKLTAQIIAGAPYDLFLSADSKYPEMLTKEGLTTRNSKIYAYGKLVMWTSLDSMTIERITDKDLKSMKVAIANPKTAPYGLAAKQSLQSSGDWNEVKHQLVFGESISQVNQFMLSGAVQIGITSKSSMYSKAFLNKETWNELPYSNYDPIAQAMVVLDSRPEMEKEAQAFFDFMLSERGQEILNNFGYSTPEN